MMGKKHNIADSLKEHETILWEGQAVPFKVLDGAEGKKLKTKTMVTLVVGITLIALYVGLVADFNPKIFGIIAIMMLVVLFSPVMDWKHLLKQQYYITNRRAILMFADGSVSSMLLTDLDDCLTIPSVDGSKSLLMGSKVIAENGKLLRWRGNHPMVDQTSGTKKVEGLVFYSVSDAEKAMKLLQHQDLQDHTM